VSSDVSIAGRILGQAWPIFFGQFAAMAFGVVDTIMTGHSSPTDLAAMGLGASIYGSVFVSLLGVVNALNPIIAHHHGAGSDAAVGASYVQGLWLALLVSAVGCPVQGITAFVLRAYRIAVVPTVIYAVALWGLGLVGGYVVGFHPVFGTPRGASGMWLMQAVALFVTSLLLMGFYLRVLRRQGAAAALDAAERH
jgi:Na+-driven multidrug efflux pump